MGVKPEPSREGDRQGRWTKIDEIVEFALAAPKGRRAGFVKAACGSDGALRQEVESLLAHVGGGEELFSNLSAALSGKGPEGSDEEDPLIGQTVRRYQIKERLPSGMASVYRAWDLSADSQVVLKLTPLGLDETAALEAARRMRREAHEETSLKHPNVCAVLDNGETDDGRAFVVLEFCPGQTLHARMATGLMPLRNALLVSAQVVDALAAAHAKGIIHRDVKPSNIMVADSLQVKLLDFGIAKLEDSRLTRTGHILGTLEYMSPEQATGLPVESSSDIWSLGAVLYEVTTGRHPFRRKSKRATIQGIQAAVLTHEGWSDPLPQDIGALIRSMLNKEPNERPSASEVRRSLHDFLSGPTGSEGSTQAV